MTSVQTAVQKKKDRPQREKRISSPRREGLQSLHQLVLQLVLKSESKLKLFPTSQPLLQFQRNPA